MMHIIALGGTTRANSTTEKLLAIAGEAAASNGAKITYFDGAYISALPHYGGPGHVDGMGREMIEAVRNADGIIIASPGYHGSISGMMKNALDYLEDLAKDERPYLHGRPVGLIATAYGYQAAMSTLLTLRSITHALRGWPTPMGAAIRTDGTSFDPDGNLTDPISRQQLELVGQQVADAAGRL